jgi:hypothetical protein
MDLMFLKYASIFCCLAENIYIISYNSHTFNFCSSFIFDILYSFHFSRLSQIEQILFTVKKYPRDHFLNRSCQAGKAAGTIEAHCRFKVL